MALQDQIGLTGPEYEVHIERGKIREFSRAMDAHLPEFLELDPPVIPPMFLVSAPYTWGYTLERPRGTVFADIQHDLSVSLHAEESFVFHGSPPKAGDKLTAKPVLENVWEKQGTNGGRLSFLTMLTRYSDPGGKIRVEQRSTSVTTQAAPGEGNWKPSLPAYVPDYPELERSSPFKNLDRAQFSQLKINQGPGPVTAPPLLKQEIVRFQGVVGEDDPLHHDPEWASSKDYPSVFALGTHQASLMSAYASYWLSPIAIRSFRVRFREVVWPGDILTYTGYVAAIEDAAKTAKIHLTCSKPDGSLVSEAWAEYDFSQ